MFLASLGLMLAAATATPASTHTLAVTHASGPVQASYQGSIVVRHRQVGSVSSAGRPSSLACHWTADLAVERTAMTANGSVASRSFTETAVASGRRPGWCSGTRSAIDRDAASAVRDIGRHVARAAQKDRPVLAAELDRMIAART